MDLNFSDDCYSSLEDLEEAQTAHWITNPLSLPPVRGLTHEEEKALFRELFPNSPRGKNLTPAARLERLDRLLKKSLRRELQEEIEKIRIQMRKVSP